MLNKVLLSVFSRNTNFFHIQQMSSFEPVSSTQCGVNKNTFLVFWANAKPISTT